MHSMLSLSDYRHDGQLHQAPTVLTSCHDRLCSSHKLLLPERFVTATQKEAKAPCINFREAVASVLRKQENKSNRKFYLKE